MQKITLDTWTDAEKKRCRECFHYITVVEPAQRAARLLWETTPPDVYIREHVPRTRVPARSPTPFECPYPHIMDSYDEMMRRRKTARTQGIIQAPDINHERKKP